jgi:hypothetical protein
MDVREVQSKRRDLEHEILTKVNSFQQETGCAVGNINTLHERMVLGDDPRKPREVSEIRVDVSLP